MGHLLSHLLFFLFLCLKNSALDLFDEAINEAGVQSDLLRETPPPPSPPPQVHWHKIRKHKIRDPDEEPTFDISPEETFALERELFIKSAEIKPAYEESIGDIDLHPQLREKQHYGPIEERRNRQERIYNGYDDDNFPPYPPKLTEDLFGMAPVADTARCYSCMSKFYEAVWPALSHVYKRPRNFTDRCNEETFDPKSVPVTHCSTICVQMWEEPTVAGVRIKGHIRGCLDDILHNGFNQSIVAWYRWLHRDSCHQYRKRDLFKLPHDQSDDSLIHVCTCYADHCNPAPAPGPPIFFVFSFTLIFRILLRLSLND
ncbi:hypothetical protein FO519_000098 [Halicephalobus sp. NKZ332]|nr:hypothetical protein FO519_000098 [Halicephalobus sp. NKZ332]